ncbi:MULTISPECIES: MBL fold metallo-hydrolase [unclassified Ornithinimicrobium]|uniref:MBL fold metallo-hydrolase n=1 Tax=unclassified Ornithinimicrobium TaxID=2615080 RepID=UPI0038542D07
MFVRSLVADAFGTNCYIVAPAEGEECLVVDPGIGVTERVRELLAEHRLRPAAVLLTHGHLDHVYSVTPVCGGTLGAYIHGDDRYRLEDPVATLPPPLREALEQQFGGRATWAEPERVVEVTDRQVLELAGLRVEVAHAPGHTEGSVLFSLPGLPHGIPAPDLDRTVLSGDVLFAGSIGRTDLPGGDPGAMTRSLRDVVLPLEDSTLVLPGHGPATTMARERVANPYLQGL